MSGKFDGPQSHKTPVFSSTPEAVHCYALQIYHQAPRDTYYERSTAAMRSKGEVINGVLETNANKPQKKLKKFHHQGTLSSSASSMMSR